MKFSNIIFPLVILFFTTTLFGQKVKDKNARFSFVSIPSKKLPDDFKTYSVNVYGSSLVAGGSNSDAAAKKITMDGFKRVAHHGAGGGGHLRIVVNTGYVSEGRASVKSRKETRTDSKTKKKTTTYYYWYELPYTAGPTYTIYDPEGNILDSGGASYQATEKTRESTGRPGSRDLTSLRRNINSSVANGIIRSCNAALAGKFDFKKRSEASEMYLIRKYETADDYTKYFEQIKKEWKELDAATPAEEIKKKFADALAFYETEAAKDPAGNKKMKRVFMASNYNLALLSYYIGDFEKAIECANKVIASEGKHRKSRKLIEKVQAAQKNMEVHGIQSMHYSRDLSNAVAPAAMKALAKQEAEQAEANNVLEGTVTAEGNEVKGTFVSSKEAKELDFSEAGNTKFVTMEGSEKVEYDLTAKEITNFTLGDRKFTKLMFTPCAKGKAKEALNIMEEIYTSDKITLYKYYPSGGTLSDAKTEYAFKKTTDEVPTSLYATQFLILKKGLAKYFSDCQDLADMCTEGAIDMEEENLIKAARIYAEVCE